MLFLYTLFAYLLAKFGKTPWDISFNNLYGQGTSKSRLPNVMQDQPMELSFAGQLHTDIRPPFGPNPQQYRLNAIEMFANKAYHDAYQKNIYNVQQPGFTDARLDPMFLSELNNYDEYHIPEPYPKQISNYWKKTSASRGPPVHRINPNVS